MYREIFLDTIEDYLVKQNITLSQLATNIGISSSTMTRWRNNISMPSIRDVRITADYIGVSVDYLFGLSEDSNTYHYDNRPFAVKLDELMSKYKITAYKLAKDCNFQKAAISKWLNGQREPRIRNIIELALYFGCTVDSLI